MKTPLFATMALATGLAVTPALAQTTTNAPSHSATASVTTASAPSDRNPLLADNGDVRIGKLIGTDVYNDKDQKLGSVDGVLMGKNGQPTVVISADNRLIQVPWSKLKFGDAKQNGDNKVIMSGETRDALNKMPEFHYTARHS